MSNVVLSQTDSIIISVLFGTIFVGYYSNYYMIITYIYSVFNIVITGIEASISNLNSVENHNKSFQVYRNISFAISLLNAFCAATFICLIQDFISIWIGNEYLQSNGLILSLVFTFYIRLSMAVVTMYRQTMGLFREVKYIYPFMAFLNIILSLILGKFIGITGVALATGLSVLLTSFWYEGRIVYNKLGKSILDYLKFQLIDALLALVITFASYVICEAVPFSGLIGLAFKLVIVMAIFVLIEWLAHKNSKEWEWFIQLMKMLTKKISRKCS
jgi:O-antigen/teichoic acid export membrane protein